MNNIVRVSDSTSNVGIGLVLEAHYFLRSYFLGWVVVVRDATFVTGFP